MTNSICLPTNILLALALWLVGPLKQSTALQPTALRIPTDSFLVFSVKADNLIDKSSIRSSETWSPFSQIGHPGILKFTKPFSMKTQVV